MKKMIAAFVAIAGVATAAQAAWGLKFEVSTDGGATWSNSVTVDTTGGAQGVKLRASAYHTNSDALAASVNGGAVTLQFNRFTGSNKITNWDASDSVSNYAKSIQAAGPTALASGAAGGTLVLGTGTGTQTQLASSFFAQSLTARSLELSVVLFTADLSIGSGNQSRILEIMNNTFGAGTIAGMTFYNTASGNATSGQPLSGRADMNAEIRVVPTPGSLALLGLGGLVAGRRRR